MEKPLLMWLSFYSPQNNTHLGTCIVRASTPERGLEIAAELGIRPAGDCLSQGLSAAAGAFYVPHLDVLMDDKELARRFGDHNVLLADGQTPLADLPAVLSGTHPRSARRAPARHNYDAPAFHQPIPR